MATIRFDFNVETMTVDSQIYFHLPHGVERSAAVALLRERASVVTTPDNGLAVKYQTKAENRSEALREAATIIATTLPLQPWQAIDICAAFLHQGEYPAHAALVAATAELSPPWKAFILTDARQDMLLCAMRPGGRRPQHGASVVFDMLQRIATRFHR